MQGFLLGNLKGAGLGEFLATFFFLARPLKDAPAGLLVDTSTDSLFRSTVHTGLGSCILFFPNMPAEQNKVDFVLLPLAFEQFCWKARTGLFSHILFFWLDH
jgi:hypothetical protein